jgi:hypothetical protein
MSSRSIIGTAILGLGEPDKRIALVNKIKAKTEAGKIQWNKTPNGSNATIPAGLAMNFVESVSSIFGPPRWVLFTVRDNRGNELVKVENNSSTPPVPTTLPLQPPPTPIQTLLQGALALDPLVDAVNQLYNVVRAEAKGEIEKAIDLLDRI